MLGLNDFMSDTFNKILRPNQRISVAEAAEKYVYLDNSPSYVGPYLNAKAPYMVEPMNMTMSREKSAVIFVGGAQTAKTQALILNTTAYVVKCNPMDALIISMSQTAARDFGKQRIDRMHRNSELIGAEVNGSADDNVFDKGYKSGMILGIRWPSVKELSSKPIPLVMFTDYDRMPDDLDGEGSPFALGQKRTTTFGSLGMTVVESSPGRDVDLDALEEQTASGYVLGKHEAPPSTGILGLYNQGDRRLWYWPCTNCGTYFAASFSDLTWKTESEQGHELPLSAVRETVRMECPHCAAQLGHHEKRTMNANGVWVPEGLTVNKDGELEGESLDLKTASYWLKGTAAAFLTWEDMVIRYIQAERHFKATGSQVMLKATVNTDQGEPYMTKGSQKQMIADDLRARATPMPEREVPEGVRALIATIDTQKNRWEVQVHGIKEGNPFDVVVIDRFMVQYSDRIGEAGDRLWVKPASYPEDWDKLTEHVIERTYPLASGEGVMGIAWVACDSHGGKGRSRTAKASGSVDMSVTMNAYNYYRRLRLEGKNKRFSLLRGNNRFDAPVVAVSYPNSQRKDRKANARGEIPVLQLNVNMLKDSLSEMLKRTEPGGGMIDFPDWLEQAWFDELVAEERKAKGWVKIGSRRNESWDLLTYFLGVCAFRGVNKVNWDKPPPWLSGWDKNPLVVLNEAPKPKETEIKAVGEPTNPFESLGRDLA